MPVSNIIEDNLEHQIIVVGVQGPKGTPGPAGNAPSVVVDPILPAIIAQDTLYIQTGLGPLGEDFTFWFDDETV